MTHRFRPSYGASLRFIRARPCQNFFCFVRACPFSEIISFRARPFQKFFCFVRARPWQNFFLFCRSPPLSEPATSLQMVNRREGHLTGYNIVGRGKICKWDFDGKNEKKNASQHNTIELWKIKKIEKKFAVFCYRNAGFLLFHKKSMTYNKKNEISELQKFFFWDNKVFWTNFLLKNGK